MDKIIGPIFQGLPGAVVIGIGYLLFILPVSNRVDHVVAVMNREVIPIINELKKERLPGPEIRPLTELSQKLSQVLSSLENQERRVADVTQQVRISLEENRRLALSAAVAPYLVLDPKKTYAKGDII